MPTDAPSGSGHHNHPITFTVDDEPVVTSDPTLSPIQIMTLAGVDPATHYLVEVKGRQQTSYRDNPSEELRIHNHDKFVTLCTGPTPVS
jgi:hypothetical protein